MNAQKEQKHVEQHDRYYALLLAANGGHFELIVTSNRATNMRVERFDDTNCM